MPNKNTRQKSVRLSEDAIARMEALRLREGRTTFSNTLDQHLLRTLPPAEQPKPGEAA